MAQPLGALHVVNPALKEGRGGWWRAGQGAADRRRDRMVWCAVGAGGDQGAVAEGTEGPDGPVTVSIGPPISSMPSSALP